MKLVLLTVLFGGLASADSIGFLDVGGIFTPVDDPLANGHTIASGINDAGQMVDYYTDATGRTHGFLDVGGTFTTINDPLALRPNLRLRDQRFGPNCGILLSIERHIGLPRCWRDFYYH
jgi:probable HAF family extracellular repeat protein